MDVARVARLAFGGATTGTACVGLKPGGPTLLGDGSVTVTCPVDDVH